MENNPCCYSCAVDSLSCACSSSTCCKSGCCDPNTEKCRDKPKHPLAGVVDGAAADLANCSGRVGLDAGGQARVAALTGTTQGECCSECSVHLRCRTWIYVPKSEPRHSAGSCWPMAGAQEATHSPTLTGSAAGTSGHRLRTTDRPASAAGRRPTAGVFSTSL